MSMRPPVTWSTPDTFPVLHPNQAHIWRCDLDALDFPNAENSLSQEERERAARFHFPIHRARFVAARGILRSLLSSYTNSSAHEIKFVLTAHGKPELNPASNPNNLRFNISHSQNFALFAFCFSNDIGVDIECARDDFDDEKIARLAKRFFGEDENRALETLSGDAVRAAFFRGWTRKEALLKATGEGISGGLAKYQVSLLPDAAPGVLQAGEAMKDWALFDLPLGDLQSDKTFAGAVAIRGENRSISVWNFSPFNEPGA